MIASRDDIPMIYTHLSAWAHFAVICFLGKTIGCDFPRLDQRIELWLLSLFFDRHCSYRKWVRSWGNQLVGKPHALVAVSLTALCQSQLTDLLFLSITHLEMIVNTTPDDTTGVRDLWPKCRAYTPLIGRRLKWGLALIVRFVTVWDCN